MEENGPPEVFHLVHYSIAANDPALLALDQEVVALDLGVMADLGKLLFSGLAAPSERWIVTAYLDRWPRHLLLSLRRDGGVVQAAREEVKPEIANAPPAERLRWLLRRSQTPRSLMGLVIGGHGDVIGGQATYFPIGMTSSEGLPEKMTIREIGEVVKSVMGPAPSLAFLALDACQLATLDSAADLAAVTDYVIAYQDDTPWNGFMNSKILDICCRLLPLAPADRRLPLSEILDLYVPDADAQEDTSSISLLNTKAAVLLRDCVRETTQKLSLKGSPHKQDFATWVRKLRPIDPKAADRLEALFAPVLACHRTPASAQVPPELRCGLSVFVGSPGGEEEEEEKKERAGEGGVNGKTGEQHVANFVLYAATRLRL